VAVLRWRACFHVFAAADNRRDGGTSLIRDPEIFDRALLAFTLTADDRLLVSGTANPAFTGHSSRGARRRKRPIYVVP
jgi:hypothetical protein